MSWLFDRMCDLAASDQLSIVIAADTEIPVSDRDSVTFAEVILRASEIPQMTIWVIPVRHLPAGPTTGAGECVDLAALPESAAVLEIDRLLVQQRRAVDAVLRVSLGTMSLHTERSSHRELEALAQCIDVDHRRLFATDTVGHSHIFSRLSSRDLGITVGAEEPNASIRVADISGVTAIVDALVTLRYFAFGMNDVHESTAARRDRDVVRITALDDIARRPNRGRVA